MDIPGGVESIERDDYFRHGGSINGSTQAVIEATRAKFVEAEAVLRDLWYDTVEQSPVLAARVNSATRVRASRSRCAAQGDPAVTTEQAMATTSGARRS